MFDRVEVHPRVFQRHPDVIAAAGADSKGRMIEMLGIEMEDGSILIYHAMKLTQKMARELGI